MARQAGPLFITGTVDDMVFYKMGDHYYMRKKGTPSSTTKKRMKHDKGYALLQLRQHEFKQASQWVKKWYYTLPKAVRKHGLFGELTGKAVRWLRKGMREEEIKTTLWQQLGQPTAPVAPPVVNDKATPAHTAVAPTYNQAKQKHKEKKKAGTGRLSSWQVGEGGQLEKKVARPETPPAKAKTGTTLFARQGYYSTWTSGGW